MNISRRNFLAVGAVLVTIPAIACSAQSPQNDDQQPPGSKAPSTRVLAMEMHRDPGCPCCEDWADLARKAGYRVSIADDPDIAARKRRLGVPEDLWSCHTTEVESFVLEGHVPLETFERLLKSGDHTIVGLAVAGMPLGSPGMAAGATLEAYEVIAFGRSGERQVFASYPARA